MNLFSPLQQFLLSSIAFFAAVHTFTVSNSDSTNIRSAPRRPNHGTNIVDNDMHQNIQNILTTTTRTGKSPSSFSHTQTTVSGRNFANSTTPPSPPLPCYLPPDFWCDDPSLALVCTGGTLAYCEAYKRGRQGRKLEMKLAFETGCPDSQKLVVNRLYPRVFSNLELADHVEFTPLPWGLARRQADQNVRCHHGPRECAGNRLLTCALKYYPRDRPKRDRILYCFMDHMMARGEPEPGLIGCVNRVGADQRAISEILQCAQTLQANAFQLDDEHATGKILSRPRFVPYMALNGKSHIHMQAPLQLLLAEKIRHWNRTVHRRNNLKLEDSHWMRTIKSQGVQPSAMCDLPPEFWCSDPTITRACFSQTLCDHFDRNNFGRPLHFRIIYNSQFAQSRDFLLRFVAAQLLNPSGPKFAENAGKFWVELEPAHFTRRALAECGIGKGGNGMMRRECARRILEVCIAAIVESVEERNRHLICVNSMPEGIANLPKAQQMDEMGGNWAMHCFPAVMHRERIFKCTTNEQIWLDHNTQLIQRQNQRALSPEPRRTDPWVIVNGYSLGSVQHYANVLDQMVCLWYRGPGHDRDKCGRCDYEPTHC